MSSSGVRLMVPISAELVEPEPRSPRLSIFHLLCWTAGTALILNCYRAYPLPSDPVRMTLCQMYMTISAIANGLAVASLFLFVRHGFRRPTVFPRHAGHWFLICGGLQAAVAWPAYFAALHWLQLHPWHPFRDGMSHELRAQLVQSAANNMVGFAIAVVALQTLAESRWRLMWWLWLFFSVIELAIVGAMLFAQPHEAYAVYRFYVTAYSALSLLYVLLLLTTAARDRHAPRDWLHFAGVGVAVIFFASGPLFYLFDALFARD